jgi:hypothetical protein
MSTVRQRNTRCKPLSAVDDVDDLTYATVARARFYCVLCRRRRATVASLVVPESYGGQRAPGNLQATCQRCDRLRHQIDGSDPAPPDPKGLERLLSIPSARSSALDLLWQAATAKTRRGRQYHSADEAVALGDAIRHRVTGWPGRHGARRKDISDDDWKWLRSPEAYEALDQACYALLPAGAA